MHRLVIEASNWAELEQHFRNAGSQETGAMVLIRTGRGANGARHLIHDVLLPGDGDWEVQNADHLRPSAQWISSAVGTAIEMGSGLAFFHTHPGSQHPSHLSPIDRSTAMSLGPVMASTGQPYAFAVWSNGGVAGWTFEAQRPADPFEIDGFQILGAGSAIDLSAAPLLTDREKDDRQILALGGLGNARLRKMQVAIVGAGGTGSPLAQQLAQMGIGDLLVIDHDVLDTPSNLRRVVGARPSDLRDRRSKAEIVSRTVNDMEGGTKANALVFDVRTAAALETLIDCDLVFNTTDTHSSRALINQLAFQYWLPVVDVGVRVGTSVSGGVTGMPTEVRVLLPDTGCLWCRKVLSSDRIREENLPSEERRSLAREGYVVGEPGPQPSLAPLNHFAASQAALTSLRMVTESLPSTWFIVDGWEGYVQTLDDAVNPGCVCAQWRGLADGGTLALLP